jgi:pimeloyl-ACP methyl ester carboxylesterase
MGRSHLHLRALRLRGALGLLGLLALLSTAAALPALASSGTRRVKPLKPFGHACVLTNGVRFCPTTDGGAGLTTNGVASFDGTPLDVDVTLPATGSGPFPTIVMVHGWGGDKTAFEATSASGDGNETWHYNNVYFAQQGYAVVNYTARGWGHSCGGGPSADHSGACAKGYVELDDTRYEARDAQTLLGILVDERITKPNAIGVTGISYGGGLSMELAYLKNRVRMPNGSLVPWTSPKGTPISITAAYPRWQWTDLADALLPNGRFLDFKSSTDGASTSPIGIPIASYLTGLYDVGLKDAYYCGDAPANPCTNSNANLTQQFNEAMAGEPYTAAEQANLRNIQKYHSAYGVPLPTGGPAALLVQNGFTDDLFPPSEALRGYNQIRAAHPKAPIALQFGDLGHSRGTNAAGVDHAFQSQAVSFFNYWLKKVGSPLKPGSVEVFREVCPAGAPIGTPFKAASWAAAHPTSLSFGGASAHTVTATGDSQDGHPFDPIFGTTDSCKAVKPAGGSGTAVYKMKSKGFTMLGLPTVRATIKTTGNYGELDSRLYDVLPGGTERLISRGAYRLLNNQTGRVVFQLHGNAYKFPARDTVKLELRGNDSDYLRASNDKTFTVQVTKLTVSLPLAP